jgi:hypothetical protein
VAFANSHSSIKTTTTQLTNPQSQPITTITSTVPLSQLPQTQIKHPNLPTHP